MTNNIRDFIEGKACPSGTCSGVIRYIKWTPIIKHGEYDDDVFTFGCTDEACDLHITITIPENQLAGR